MRGREASRVQSSGADAGRRAPAARQEGKSGHAGKRASGTSPSNMGEIDHLATTTGPRPQSLSGRHSRAGHPSHVDPTDCPSPPLLWHRLCQSGDVYCGSTSTLMLTPLAVPPRANVVDRPADGGDRGAAFARLDDDLADRARPRSANSGAGPSTARPARRSSASQLPGGRADRGAGVDRRADDPDQRRERRVAERPPPLELVREEPDRSRAARRTGSSARSGASVCTSTRPPPSPRPARPASCVISANVRSSARKSGNRSV